MVNFRASVNTKRIDNLAIQIAALPKNIQDDALEVASDYEAEVARELGTVPPPAKLPFEFATPKSKRYYFWAVKQGLIATSNGRYVRRGKTPYGWRTDVEVQGNEYIIRIANTWNKSLYVYGTLSATGFDTRIPGHKNTGWQLAKPKAEAIARRIVQDLIRRVIKRVGRL